MKTPWVAVEPLGDAEFVRFRRRAIFECDKWDPQVGDACVIARYPLVLTKAAWRDVVALGEALARETRAAEAELVERPDLHGRLGLPRAIRRALGQAPGRAPAGAARIIRFDFHFTSEGWRISEGNIDVPGGLNEASGFPRIIGSHYPWAEPVGDPAAAYVEAIAAAAPPAAVVALVHATAYSDDQQMMLFVARRLEARGIRAHLASPSHLRWQDGRARLEAAWWRGPLDLVVRFFPAEWLPQLPRASGWRQLCAGALTPISNPATAILTQSKRFPLVWNDLATRLPTWRAMLPETREPRAAPWRTSRDWILKPALGRVGEGVGIDGLTDASEWRKIARDATWWPAHWIAQRRFDVVPIRIAGIDRFPCLGVYTVDERVVGAYGRLADRPLIDARAEDAAVLAA
ncbi:MAG TPA: glutathionylspermidine synthase family protein [Vicinamibacterales bacterium]|nr:glutathionylspermidine synthase family protein [Vicinamibacterales bacterium]